MTREEAIEKLQEYDNVAGLLMTLPHEVCKMAIADMERQIPRKIANYRKTENAIYGNCLICGRRVIKDNYCPKCGTSLDWSRENE